MRGVGFDADSGREGPGEGDEGRGEHAGGSVVGDGASNCCGAGTSVAPFAAAGTGNNIGAVAAKGVAAVVTASDAVTDADVDDPDAFDDNNIADTVNAADAISVRSPGSHSSSSSSD